MLHEALPNLAFALFSKIFFSRKALLPKLFFYAGIIAQNIFLRKALLPKILFCQKLCFAKNLIFYHSFSYDYDFIK